MASQHADKSQKKGGPGKVDVRSATGQVADGQSVKLKKAGAQLGNEEIQQQIKKSNASRDEMLSFLCHRLNTIRGVQLRELEQVGQRQQWWKKVSDSQKDDITKPDPERWAEAAKIYEHAAHLLCKGDVYGGTREMMTALDTEKRLFENTTKLVKIEDAEKEADVPGTAKNVIKYEQCAPCDIPDDVKIAAQIEKVTAEVEDPHVKKRVKDPWWTLDEEEEEEEGEGGAA